MGNLSKIVVKGNTIRVDGSASGGNDIIKDYNIQIGSTLTLTEYVMLIPNGNGPLVNTPNYHSFIVELPIGVTIKSEQSVYVCFFDEYPTVGSQYVDGKYSLGNEVKVTHKYAFIYGSVSLNSVQLHIGNNLYEDIYRFNFLKGKKILCFGDSNTDRVSQDTSDGSYGKSYPQLISKYANCTVYNVGIGGTRFARRLDLVDGAIGNVHQAYARLDFISLVESLVSQDFTEQDKAVNYLNLYSTQINTLKSVNLNDIDIVTIYFGNNDWQAKQTIGDLHSTTATETYGAINIALQAMLSVNPRLKFYFIAPFPSYKIDSNSGISYWSSDIELNGITLEDLVEKIKVIAGYYGAPVLDLYHTLGINPYTIEYYGRNRLEQHITMGYSMLAKKIIKFLNSN